MLTWWPWIHRDRLEQQASRHRAHIRDLQRELDRMRGQRDALKLQLDTRLQFETEVLDDQFRAIHGIPKSDFDPSRPSVHGGPYPDSGGEPIGGG